MRPPDARYLHEQNAFKQPGARATAGYSALVRRSCQLFRSKEKFVRLNIGTRAAGEICFPPGNAENRNPELARQAAAGLRFFVAGKKFERIGGKSYKADEETTARVENSDLLRITKQAV
jgi:hypothetical protein